MLEFLPSLLYLFGLMSFGLIVWWAVSNDNLGDDSGSVGLFAMRAEPKKKSDEADKAARWKRRV